MSDLSEALTCPACSNSLQLEMLPGSNAAWRCPSCSGVALNLAVVRAEFDARAAAAFWSFARTAQPSTRPCPSCRRVLRQIHHTLAFGSVEIDLCTTCQITWFDRGELEHFSGTKPARLPDPARRRISKPPRDFSMEPVLPEASYPIIDILDWAWEFVSSLDIQPPGD